MKFKIILASIIVILATHDAYAQGAFQNLNFESAVIPPSTPVNSDIPISEALPGWSAYFTSGSTIVAQTQVGFDFISLGGNVISVVDNNVENSFFGPIRGNYSAYLFGGGGDQLYSATISQTGLVPGGTESLVFDAYVNGASFDVTLGGQTIYMTALESFANYTVYGGNIPSAFAGQSETLSFTEPPATGAQPSFLELDDISFSPNAVPEPSPLALTAVGGALYAFYRRFAFKRP